MSTLIEATLSGGAADELVVDAITQEAGQDTATITEHPVEAGSNISDHVRPEAEKLKFEIILTNTPLESGMNPGFAERRLATLKYWREQGALLSFDTTTGSVSNVAIESISWTRDAKTGGQPDATGGLRISLGVKQIRIVKNSLTKVAISKSPNVDAKKKTGKTPVNELDQDSPALQVAEAAWSGGKKVAGVVGDVAGTLAGGL